MNKKLDVQLWLEKRGGSGVFAKTRPNEALGWKGGGRVFIASGEVAPFSPATVLKLVKLGLADKTGERVVLRA